MSEGAPPRRPVLVLGLSHKTAPVDVRERFSAGKEILPEVLARLASRKELAEVLFLSTCNRVEVVALPALDVGADGEAASRAVRDALAAHVGAESSDLAAYLYEKRGEEAVRHVFRVAASLDSMVLGEPQILGQVKDAVDAAQAAGTVTGFLGRCFQRAFTVAKRVRTETALGAGTVSISSVAVDLARKIFGDLDDRVVLLVGAGEMAEAAAKSLGKSAKSIRVCNRSFERAAHLAQEFGGSAAPFEQLEQELVQADVVVVSTGSSSYVIGPDLVRRVMKARRGRTLFVVDIAVPRNVDPRVHAIDNTFVYNIDDLEAHVAESMKSRAAEAARAEAIVEQELGEWRKWSRGLDVSPTIVSLRAKVRGTLVAEVDRTLAGKLKHLSEADRAALAQLVESATNKILHHPTALLRRAASGDEAAVELVDAAARLFDLPAPEPRTGDGSAPPGPGRARAEAVRHDDGDVGDDGDDGDGARDGGRVAH